MREEKENNERKFDKRINDVCENQLNMNTLNR